MIDIVGFVRLNLVKPKVLHSIPGRLRIAVPGLKDAPPFLFDILTELDLSVTGIISVKASEYTGNILIMYDMEIVGQEEILTAITTMALTFLAYREQFLSIPEDRILKTTENFKEYLTENAALLNGKELVLPDDIW